MRIIVLLFLLLFAIAAPAFPSFKEGERSVSTVISNTAYTTERKDFYLGTNGLVYGVSEHTHINSWGFLGYGKDQGVTIGVGFGIKHKLFDETADSPAVALNAHYYTLINPDIHATLPDLLEPFNIGTFYNATSFGISCSRSLTDKLYVHYGIQLYDYSMPTIRDYKCQLINLSLEDRINEWVRGYAEIDLDIVNTVLNYGIKLDTAPTDMIRISIGYMAGVAQKTGISASQYIIGTALYF